jgi:hypothetical protein
MYNLLDLVIKIDALIKLDWGHAPPRNVHNIPQFVKNTSPPRIQIPRLFSPSADSRLPAFAIRLQALNSYQWRPDALATEQCEMTNPSRSSVEPVGCFSIQLLELLIQLGEFLILYH